MNEFRSYFILDLIFIYLCICRRIRMIRLRDSLSSIINKKQKLYYNLWRKKVESLFSKNTKFFLIILLNTKGVKHLIKGEGVR